MRQVLKINLKQVMGTSTAVIQELIKTAGFGVGLIRVLLKTQRQYMISLKVRQRILI